MSADNVILIGRFPKNRIGDNHYIYRVTETSMSQLDYVDDYLPEEGSLVNDDYLDALIVNLFGGCMDETTNIEDAKMRASEIEIGISQDDFGILEYGIQTHIFNQPFPKISLRRANEIIDEWNKKEQENYAALEKAGCMGDPDKNEEDNEDWREKNPERYEKLQKEAKELCEEEDYLNDDGIDELLSG